MKSVANEAVKTGLNYATGVLFDLDDCGVSVISIELGCGRPVITVDAPPPTARMTAQIHTQFQMGHEVWRHTEMRGCRVQWMPAARAA